MSIWPAITKEEQRCYLRLPRVFTLAAWCSREAPLQCIGTNCFQEHRGTTGSTFIFVSPCKPSPHAPIIFLCSIFLIEVRLLKPQRSVSLRGMGSDFRTMINAASNCDFNEETCLSSTWKRSGGPEMRNDVYIFRDWQHADLFPFRVDQFVAREGSMAEATHWEGIKKIIHKTFEKVVLVFFNCLKSI